jgi:hypothetical protein
MASGLFDDQNYSICRVGVVNCAVSRGTMNNHISRPFDDSSDDCDGLWSTNEIVPKGSKKAAAVKLPAVTIHNQRKPRRWKTILATLIAAVSLPGFWAWPRVAAITESAMLVPALSVAAPTSSLTAPINSLLDYEELRKDPLFVEFLQREVRQIAETTVRIEKPEPVEVVTKPPPKPVAKLPNGETPDDYAVPQPRRTQINKTPTLEELGGISLEEYESWRKFYEENPRLLKTPKR